MYTVRRATCMLFLAATLIASAPARAAKTRVCVEVSLHDGGRPSARAAPRKKPNKQPTSQASDHTAPGTKPEVPVPERWLDEVVGSDLSMVPAGQTPVRYLRRLLEHFVTHEPGFVASKDSCQQRLRVDLYPLRRGWTVFARYSGHGREEWVDHLHPDEISQFAERAVLALLHNRPISATIMRDTVLRADTRVPKRWVGGTHHFALALGTQLRGGVLSTVQDDNKTVEGDVRLFSPMTLSAGYRGKFENWAIESMVNIGIGTSKTALINNPTGGHVDLGGAASIALHFLRYFNPRGVTSFYMGTGGTFELLWFNAIINQQDRTAESKRSTILGGGVDVDLVLGWEFMRATSIHWMIQGELHLPAYVVDNENDHAEIHTWLPGLSVRLGVLF